jgi:hypothetical protein
VDWIHFYSATVSPLSKRSICRKAQAIICLDDLLYIQTCSIATNLCYIALVYIPRKSISSMPSGVRRAEWPFVTFWLETRPWTHLSNRRASLLQILFQNIWVV